MIIFIDGCSFDDKSSCLDMRSKKLDGVETTNLSAAEDWGRWTDGSPAIFKFPKGLPTHFKLIMKVAGAFGPNQGKTFIVKVGDQSINFIPATTNPIELEFNKVSTDTLLILTPEPISPKELGQSGDTRKLGLAIRKLEIVPITTN